jgi:hypothetical protein
MSYGTSNIQQRNVVWQVLNCNEVVNVMWIIQHKYHDGLRNKLNAVSYSLWVDYFCKRRNRNFSKLCIILHVPNQNMNNCTLQYSVNCETHKEQVSSLINTFQGFMANNLINNYTQLTLLNMLQITVKSMK